MSGLQDVTFEGLHVTGGVGNPVVLVHGFGVSRSYMLPLARVLRCITPGLRPRPVARHLTIAEVVCSSNLLPKVERFGPYQTLVCSVY